MFFAASINNDAENNDIDDSANDEVWQWSFSVKQWLQLRFDIESTAVWLFIERRVTVM